MNTKFKTPHQRFRIIEKVKMGDLVAEEQLHKEIDRLEKRIRRLELACEVVVEKFQNNV